MKSKFRWSQMAATTKGLSALQVAGRYGIRPRTAWTFMHKVREAMESSGTKPMNDDAHVDGFAVSGKETKRPGRSYRGKKRS
ncbi:hypothetical protein J2X69_005121 [Algoriphagus sp. 4150]|uniref:hypothetical protein n=1 Tax=Algoriphagus sp. 4150 TaxID=2817756 RepID=UPI002865C31D|nr:hypothetical protein [Algoriphagus sp. 4150]MDR7132747.1 hypothetical protein [Algoriphagus sp. 4150]